MAKAQAHYQALLNDRGAAAMPTSLKMTSRALGFKVMDPFDWTKDKDIYQRWQMWSEKARHAIDAMEGDSEKTKISYFNHWIDSEGMAKIESWKNKKVLISQEDYEKLEENEKEGKYSSEKRESYFTLSELLLAPKSNLLLAVEGLFFAKQGSMNSGEFHAHVVKIAKRCKFPCTKAEERAIRDTIFLGMNSTQARDKAINLMNEEGKELTVEFLMQQLEIEDCNAHHKSTSINFAAYDCSQNKAKGNKITEVMEKIRERIILEDKDLLILVINLENPQGWRTSALDVENRNTSWGKGVQPRMPNAKTVIKFDISTRYARTRKELNREPILFKPPRMMMTPALMKMESDKQIYQG